MKTTLAILVCGIVAFSLAGCTLVGTVLEPVAGQSLTTSDIAFETDQPANDTQLLRNEAHGYTLRYPEGYTAEQPNPDETVLVIGSLLNVEQPRLHIEVGHAEGRTAAQVADELLVEVEAAMPGFNVKRTTAMVGGEESVVLDQLPGQDINRQVIFMHEDRLYKLMFAPADEADSDRYAQMESLYTTIIGSFNFLPNVSSAVTPTHAEDITLEPYLVWEGHTGSGDGDTDSCKSLVIASGDQARVGPCGETQPKGTLPANHSREFPEMLARFAPFEYDTPLEHVDFRGKGQVAGPAWERAVAAWADFTYDELLAGRVSASVKTIMAWPLGEIPEQPGYCEQLIVLVYGYAYAHVIPCQGGPVQEAVSGWLETDEWEQFDAWLYSRAPVYQDEGYFAGEGAEDMTEAEIAELSNWAETVHARLSN